MPVRNDEQSDAATFSNMDPTTSEANVLGGNNTMVIWGTNVSVADSSAAMRDFLRNFQKKYRMVADGSLDEVSNLSPDHPGNVKEYVEMMKTMLDLGTTALNFDARNLKAYPPTRKLWNQLQSFPSEIIPLMDVAVRDIMVDIAEEREKELRSQQQRNTQERARTRDQSSLPPAPDSEADHPNGNVNGEQMPEIPDLVREVASKPYRVRPFGLDRTINLRELNPEGDCVLNS